LNHEESRMIFFYLVSISIAFVRQMNAYPQQKKFNFCPIVTYHNFLRELSKQGNDLTPHYCMK